MKTNLEEQIKILRAVIKSSIIREYEKAGILYDEVAVALRGPTHKYRMYDHDCIMLRILECECRIESFAKNADKYTSYIELQKKALKNHWKKLRELVID